MSDDVAVVRSAASLSDAETGIRDIATRTDELRLDTFAAIEVRNMILLASQIVASAAFREESRGGQFRSDFSTREPGLDGEHQIVQATGDGFIRTYGHLHDVLPRCAPVEPVAVAQ
ncbi:MAG: hypothetical protein QM753_08390 [Thermomicrobiales bacterium]